jgi:hypothetical protein
MTADTAVLQRSQKTKYTGLLLYMSLTIAEVFRTQKKPFQGAYKNSDLNHLSLLDTNYFSIPVNKVRT